MNLVVFASEAKGLSSLNSVIDEASKRNINLFIMICQDTQLRHPISNKDRFQILTNCDPIDPVYSDTLGTSLPFKPDWLIVDRERWEPETSIILEFKQKFNCKVGLVEINSQLVNNAETVLETHSRNRFIPYIDVFFEHSTHTNKQRKISGFKGNSVIVGNPKYDINLTPSSQELKDLKEYYKIDPNKEQVLIFSLITTNRNKFFEVVERFINSNPKYQYFIKPYPGEPFLPHFSKDYFPNFKIKNVTPILEENHIWSMFNLCDIHMGCLSSIIHASLLLKKKFINISNEVNPPKTYLQTDHIFNSNNKGLEDSADLWMRSFNFTNIQQLKDLFPAGIFEEIEKNNKITWESGDD